MQSFSDLSYLRAHARSHGHVHGRGLLDLPDLPDLPYPVGIYHRQTNLGLCRVGRVCHRNLCVDARRGLGPIRGHLCGWSSGPPFLWHGSRGLTSMYQPRIRVWILLSYGEEISIVGVRLCLRRVRDARRAKAC